MSFIIIMRGYAEYGLDKLISGYFCLFNRLGAYRTINHNFEEILFNQFHN